MKILRYSCLGFIAAGLLVGCTSTSKTSSPNKPVADDAEYSRETPTGSWISRKVRKTPTSEQVTDEAQQALAELQRRGNQTKRGE